MLAAPLYTLRVFATLVLLGSIETLVILTVIATAAFATLAMIEIACDMIVRRASVWFDHERGHNILENGVKLGLPGSELTQDVSALECFQTLCAFRG